MAKCDDMMTVDWSNIWDRLLRLNLAYKGYKEWE